MKRNGFVSSKGNVEDGPAFSQVRNQTAAYVVQFILVWIMVAIFILIINLFNFIKYYLRLEIPIKFFMP